MIEVDDLTKSYGPVHAVDGLSFTVQPGRVTGFLGPNGAGKSTTMRLVLGLDRPTRGTATVRGRPYGHYRRPLFEVGAMLESGAVHGGRSARNHLLCLARSNGIGSSRVDQVLASVGLTEVAHKRAGGFSLGMSQRLGLAAALLGDPKTLILDEPVNGLDPEGIRWIRELLRGLAREGRTVLVSSHLMSEMAQTAEHLVVIGRGRLIADTSVSDFLARSSGGSVRVRSPQSPALAALVREHGGQVEEGPEALTVNGLTCEAVGDLAATHGLTLHELSVQAASLEEAFMELTQDSVQYRADAGAGQTTSIGA